MTDRYEPVARGRRITREQVTTAIDVAALVLVIVGVWLIFVPAALIVAGTGLAAISWQASR